MTAIATIETKISCLSQSSPRHHSALVIETFTYCCCCWLATAAAVPAEKGQVSGRFRLNPGCFPRFRVHLSTKFGDVAHAWARPRIWYSMQSRTIRPQGPNGATRLGRLHAYVLS